MKPVRGGARGDLFCRVVVETPVKLGAEQHELIRQLDESLRGDSHRHAPREQGFFEGVKRFFSERPAAHDSRGARRRRPAAWVRRSSASAAMPDASRITAAIASATSAQLGARCGRARRASRPSTSRSPATFAAALAGCRRRHRFLTAPCDRRRILPPAALRKSRCSSARPAIAADLAARLRARRARHRTPRCA